MKILQKFLALVTLIVSFSLSAQAQQQCGTVVECAQQAVDIADRQQSRITALEEQVRSQSQLLDTLLAKLGGAPVQLHSCSDASSLAWVNNFDQPIDYVCPAGQVMVGMNSDHQNDYEDRRFRFACCSMRIGDLSN